MKTIQLPTITLRRKSKDVLESPEALSAAMSTEKTEKSSNGAGGEKRKNKIKFPDRMRMTSLMKRHKPKSPEVPVVLDFNQNLEQNHLAEASQHLLAQEEHLFSSESADEQVVCTDDDEDRLQKDYETLKLRLRMVIHDSFNTDNQEALKSAVATILQEEERDRIWEKTAKHECPVWRPMGCREIHDTLLQKVVEVRLQRANEEESGADKLSTSLKKDVCRMGKRIQNDLLRVVRDVQGCYPPEFDVCNMYTQLYHQAFSTKLQELTQPNTELEDCIYILSWINDYYPKGVLQQKELESHISSEALGPLLPEESLKALEEQYLSHKEAEVRTWLSSALKKEEEHWQTDEKPELMDNYYISHLALDVIHLVDGAIKEAVTILGNEDKAQRILFQLASFLASYKKSIAELLKGKNKNIPDMLKASLVSIKQLREYIEARENLSDVKGTWLSTAADLRESCHRYFLSTTHKELKGHYRKLWTQTWFSGSHNIIGNLLSALEDQITHFTFLKPACMEELLSQLHTEVMTEYVRRMLKRKVKLKDKDEQETAATFLCEDSTRINALFVRNGSKEKWLSSVLPKMSEVLRLQDAGSLQLEIVTLARTYPDISERQVLALLQLKTNLSSVDVRNIKDSLNENRNSPVSEPPPPFFCNVPVKRTLI
ncbi:tumor necrosis factor alpha-induced protein 2-like [Colossoma macropomum]|uniref:tumor necrosis factor alpha-induced protein 2-like n=1 Tax=Colossoma macropomum TaxID=42526 RepID=UPI0018652844|nr:tumor necrosis factor alpha-induced protein 2-like [Colossoma macropomum]